ncbi:MAG: hypothetical protein P8M70_02350 [Verrucomicrobiota bacterium]|nr:hypothetical protein [Verrucomicrobiota bacterium]
MKNLIIPLLSAAVVFGGLLTEPNAFAADKPVKKKSAFFPFRGMIKTVDTEKDTFTLSGAKGKPDRVFVLAKEAKLTLDGEKADIKDIKAKMWVGGRAKRLSTESVEALTVNVKTKKPERKKKPIEKKEE